MKQNIIRYEKKRTIQFLIVSFLLYLLSRQSLKVENGQFERQYSRIYTGLVLILVAILFLVIISLAWKIINSIFKHNQSSER